MEVPQDLIKEEPDTLIYAWPLEGEARLILKVYRRVGILHWMRKRLVGFRARREFHALGALQAASVDCCEPLFWGIGRCPEHGRFEFLGTREIPGAVTLQETMPRLAPRERAEVLEQLYEKVARMHHRGVYWGAPFLGNVLVSPRDGWSGRVMIVDLEKSVRFPGDIRGSRMALFDLINLVTTTRRYAGQVKVRQALVRYGLAVDEIRRVLAAADAFRSTKFQRYRRRAEFLARGVLTRTLASASRFLPRAMRFYV